ncbi:hypothetical protein CsSME_00049896 [Camellia sinensis var. sinensis]
MRKLKVIKEQVKLWNREVFGNLESSKLQVMGRMEEIDSLEMQRNEVEDLRRERRELGVKLEELTLREQIFWAQKAKVRWLKEGDVSSKFFHRVADGKRKKKFIKRLEVRPGVVVDSEEQIVQGILDFYSKLFSKDEIECAIWLERPFEEMEIKDAVFECERDKAPGPDGFSLAVFQDCWEVVKGDLVKVFMEFYESGVVNLCANVTFICLIPKRDGAIQIGDTISSTQGAFVQGRQILDVVLVANEVVEECRKSRKRGLVFTADFEKAYDHVDWHFLDFVMAKKGYEMLKFWEDVWVGSMSLVESYPLLYGVSQSHNCSVTSMVGSLVVPLFWNFNFHWNLHDREVSELISLLSRLENVYLSPMLKDRLVCPSFSPPFAPSRSISLSLPLPLARSHSLSLSLFLSVDLSLSLYRLSLSLSICFFFF